MKIRMLAVAVSLIALNLPAWSKVNDRYVAYFTDIESINPQITKEQCQSIFGEPLYYSFISGKALYVKNKNLTVLDYKSIQKVPLEEDRELYLGELSLEIILDGKKVPVKNLVVMRLRHNEHKVIGGWYAAGYCKGLLHGDNIGPPA